MADESGGDARGSIGARLRAGRERMGLTVLLAAEKLHVDAKILEALEAEDFDVLGAPVFVRGHIRRYAELVGESATELQELYAATPHAAPPDLTRIPQPERHPDARKLAGPALVVATGFAIMGAVWWVLQGLETRTKPFGGSSLVKSATSPGERAPVGPAAPPEDGATTLPVAVAQAPAPAEVIRTRTDDGGPAPGNVAASVTMPSNRARGAEPARPIELELRFSEDCWVEVYDANGESVFFGIGSAGSERSVTGAPPLRVLLGNAPAVALDVNGRAAEIPDFVRHREVARFYIDRSGSILRTQPQTNGG